MRFVHPGFAVLKLASFVSLQGILAFLLVALALFLRAGALSGNGIVGRSTEHGARSPRKKRRVSPSS